MTHAPASLKRAQALQWYIRHSAVVYLPACSAYLVVLLLLHQLPVPVYAVQHGRRQCGSWDVQLQCSQGVPVHKETQQLADCALWRKNKYFLHASGQDDALLRMLNTLGNGGCLSTQDSSCATEANTFQGSEFDTPLLSKHAAHLLSMRLKTLRSSGRFSIHDWKVRWLALQGSK